jgi:NAD(P)-dependent dehydrogenase (short-subunit alcohol dehydrogenase family)
LAVQRTSGRFDGSVVLVTGAAHGIGRACAIRLASEGARVIAADLNQEVVEEVVQQLPGPGHRSVVLDVTQQHSVDQAFSAVTGEGLDVLVNVAGGDTAHGSFEDTDDDVWHQMTELNLLGVVRCCRAAIPQLRRSTSNPAIINVSSVNALTALGSEPYSSAKAGVVSLTANLALTLGPDNIRVNGVAPGTIRTRVWDGQAGGADRLRPLYPLGRVGEPDDVAAAVAFLASTDAAWITGHTLPVDGGFLTSH